MEKDIEQEPFFEFYFKRPILKIFGWWECGFCGEFYSPRVVKYGFLFIRCSKCKNKV